jgi:hypothetical protein
MKLMVMASLQVVVVQQPRGSYTLEVFKGYLAVGGDSTQPLISFLK